MTNVLGTGRPHFRIRGAETTSVPSRGAPPRIPGVDLGYKSPTAHLTPGQAQCIEALGGPCGPSSPGSMELASARARPLAPRSFLPAACPNRNCGHLLPRGLSSLLRALVCAPVALAWAPHTPTSPQSFLGPSPSAVGKGQSVRSCPRLLDVSTRHRPASVPHDMLHMYILSGGEADPGARRENEGWKDWSQLSPGAAAAGKGRHILCPRGKGSRSWKSGR